MEKIKRLVWLGIAIGVIGVLAGCATGPMVGKANVPAPEKIETLQMSPLSLEVLDETKQEKNQTFIQSLENDLKLELSNNRIQMDTEADKTLKVSVKSVHQTGYAKEFITGPFHGPSYLKLSVTLTDKTGTSLAEFPVAPFYGNTKAISNLLKSPGKITKKLAQEIVSSLISLKKR
ncbi:MAG: hypothetical protein WC081_07005 [Candidatus Ratteibacteria bacterium]|jgi:hypothetical protein